MIHFFFFSSFFLSFDKAFNPPCLISISITPSNKTSTFIPESSEGSIVRTSYGERVNDDHAEEVVSDFRSHQKKSLLPDLNEVNISLLIFVRQLLCLALIMVTGVRVMNTVIVPRLDKIIMAITFSLVMPHTYKKTLVNLLTSKRNWVTTDEQPAYPKFRKKTYQV
ncbi:hypothetical protein Hanom_Chr08g00705391 [Helianthus anomalus]